MFRHQSQKVDPQIQAFSVTLARAEAGKFLQLIPSLIGILALGQSRGGQEAHWTVAEGPSAGRPR